MSECHQLHPLLSQYLEGELSAKDKRRVAWHLNHCASARKELFEIDKLRKRMAELPEPAFPPKLHDRIMNRIYRPHLVEDVTEETQRSRAKHGGGGWDSPFKSWMAKPLWGLAAAAILAFVFIRVNPDWLSRLPRTSPSLFETDRRQLSGAPEETGPLQGFPSEETPAADVVGRLPGVPEDETVAKGTLPAGTQALAQDQSRPETTYPLRKKKLMENIREQEARSSRVVAESAPKKEASAAVRAAPPKTKPAPAAPVAARPAPKTVAPARDRLAEMLGTAGPAKNKPEASRVAVKAASLSGAMGFAEAGSARSDAAAPSAPAGGEGSPEDQAVPSVEAPSLRWSGPNARMATETQEIIGDPQTWKAYWMLLNPAEPPPDVDFTAHSAILLVSAEKPTAGWRTTVDRVEETTSNVIVWWREEGPAPEGLAAQVITRPWSLQVVPKPAKPVIFKKKD